MKKVFLFSTLMLVLTAMIMPQIIKAQSTEFDTHETHVTSFGTYDFHGKHFCILSNVENVSSDDLEFKEYAKLISLAFQQAGGIEVSPQSDKAEICVLLSYDIKDGSYVRTVSEPVWGRTGVRSVTANTYSFGTVYNYHYDYGVVDYKQSQQMVNKFIRYIDLFVYELSSNNKEEQKMVWKAYAKSEGSESVLSKVFPSMAFTTAGVIGHTNADFFVPWPFLYAGEFSEGSFMNKTSTIFPPVDNGEVQTITFQSWTDNYLICKITKGEGGTGVLIKLRWNKGGYTWYKLFKNTYITYNGEKYQCNYAYDALGGIIDLGKFKQVYNSSQFTYLILGFPAIPQDADVIDLISKMNQKRAIVWKGIHLQKPEGKE